MNSSLDHKVTGLLSRMQVPQAGSSSVGAVGPVARWSGRGILLFRHGSSEVTVTESAWQSPSGSDCPVPARRRAAPARLSSDGPGPEMI